MTSYIPPGHHADEFSLIVSYKSRNVPVPGFYLNAHFANEGASADIADDVLLTPTAFAEILKAVEGQTGANALRSPGLARLGEEIADAGVQRARELIVTLHERVARDQDSLRRLREAVAHAEDGT